ncbi:MAG TPA: isopentenyl-diphosphate Delta-isomerase [Pseudonocardiaceae bacterium]
MSERRLVELVDAEGNPVGACTVAEAHAPPGRLHRAFSVLLFDGEGRMLMQQRALTKSRFAGRWTNTCCSHPAPGEDVLTAARRRLGEELGLGEVARLREVGRFVYRAADPTGNAVEHEYDHVLVGECAGLPMPTPAAEEVNSLRWMTAAEVRRDLAAAPDRHSPWLSDVMRCTFG